MEFREITRAITATVVVESVVSDESRLVVTPCTSPGRDAGMISGAPLDVRGEPFAPP